MSLYSWEKKRAFLDNLDDKRHGTNTGYHIAYCTCDKCEAYRSEYNRKKREQAKARAEAKKAALEEKRKAYKPRVNPKDVCTVDEVFKPMLGKPSIKAPYCVVCGSTKNLEQHHPVKRSEGVWIRDGREVKKPTLTLCRKCHGKVHSKGGLMWFRWRNTSGGDWVDGTASVSGSGVYEYLELSKEEEEKWRAEHPLPNGELPSKIGYMNALEMKGWRRII